MNSQDVFNTPEQDVVLLAKELNEIKEILRDLSRKLSRIEDRASRAFPSAFPKPVTKPKGERSRKLSHPTMSAEQAMRLYDEVVDEAKGGNMEKVRSRLEAMESADLNLLRTELGASIGKKKPSKRVLMEAVLGRVNESVMLTRHINRSQLIDQASSPETISGQSEKE
jgi:hypothetical protein